MSYPLFSIIIPTFNSAKTLKSCLESILNQTFGNFEILIIDGVSGDNTLQIASSFQDDRVRIYSEPDKGIYDAMNKGIELAKGEWLYFLGSDDKLTTLILSKVAIILGNCNEKVIYGDVIIDGDAGWAKDGEIYSGEFDYMKLKTKNICHQAIFYHRTVFVNRKYNIEDEICADHVLNLSLFTHYKFQYINEIIAIFKGGGKSFVTYNDNTNNHLLFYSKLIHKAKIIKSFITIKRAK